MTYEVDATKPFSGTVAGSHPNGRKYTEASFVNGNQEGLQTEWYENGQKANERNYAGGLKESLQTEWNYRRRTIRQWNYVNGQSDSAGIYVNRTSVAEYSEYSWNMFRSGDTSELDILVRPGTTVQVTLQLPRDEELNTFVGLGEFRGWIDKLHPRDKAIDDPIWGGALHVEPFDDVRFLESCDELV